MVCSVGSVANCKGPCLEAVELLSFQAVAQHQHEKNYVQDTIYMVVSHESSISNDILCATVDQKEYCSHLRCCDHHPPTIPSFRPFLPRQNRPDVVSYNVLLQALGLGSLGSPGPSKHRWKMKV